RFRCAGCDHFRTDVSYLPDLTAYLDDLLRTREGLAASIDGVDEWVRADATPSQEEITRIRRLINRIKGDIAELPATDRARIDDAVTVIRKHRAVNLGMPTIPVHPPSHSNVAHRSDDERPPGRLRPAPSTRHRRAQPRHHRRNRDQRVRRRPLRRGRTDLPLPTP